MRGVLPWFMQPLLALSAIYAMFMFVNRHDRNLCVMTYMYEWPEYTSVDVMANESTQYSLYVYSEGRHVPAKKGVPVLFVPGNAGSYKQARSLASVALRKALTYGNKRIFDYYAVDFHEEMSGVHGGFLWQQTDYVVACIQYILDEYQTNSLVIIGHSMGGLVSVGAVNSLPEEYSKRIYMVVALASPFTAKLPTDVNLVGYQRFLTNTRPTGDWLLLSICSGSRDTFVRSDWCKASRSLSMPHRIFEASAPAIPTVWASTDHNCIAWCNQLVRLVNRILFDLWQEPGTLRANMETRRMAIRYHMYNRNSHRATYLEVPPRFVDTPDEPTTIEKFVELPRSFLLATNKSASYPISLSKTKCPYTIITASNTSRISHVTISQASEKSQSVLLPGASNHIQARFDTVADCSANPTLDVPAIKDKATERIIIGLADEKSIELQGSEEVQLAPSQILFRRFHFNLRSLFQSNRVHLHSHCLESTTHVALFSHVALYIDDTFFTVRRFNSSEESEGDMLIQWEPRQLGAIVSLHVYLEPNCSHILSLQSDVPSLVVSSFRWFALEAALFVLVFQGMRSLIDLSKTTATKDVVAAALSMSLVAGIAASCVNTDTMASAVLERWNGVFETAMRNLVPLAVNLDFFTVCIVVSLLLSFDVILNGAATAFRYLAIFLSSLLNRIHHVDLSTPHYSPLVDAALSFVLYRLGRFLCAGLALTVYSVLAVARLCAQLQLVERALTAAADPSSASTSRTAPKELLHQADALRDSIAIRSMCSIVLLSFTACSIGSWFQQLKEAGSLDLPNDYWLILLACVCVTRVVLSALHWFVDKDRTRKGRKATVFFQ